MNTQLMNGFNKILINKNLSIIFCLFYMFSFFVSNCYSEDNNYLLTIDKDLISLECKNIKISELIKKLAEKFDYEYKIYPEMENKKISINFSDQPINNAIELIAGNNYVLVFEKNKKFNKHDPIIANQTSNQFSNEFKIKKVYILNKGKDNIIYKKIKTFHDNIFPETDYLKDIVSSKIKDIYNNAQLFEIIPHYDFNEKLKSYVFTYYIGNDSTPSRDNLNEIIQIAYNDKMRSINEFNQYYKEKNYEKAKIAINNSKNYSRLISQEHNFYSVEVGASYEIPPIMAAWNGLPLDISQYPASLNVISNALQGTGFKFDKTYTDGIFSIFFAFKTNQNKVYYVNPKNKTIFTSWKINNSKQNKNKKTKEVKFKWERFLNV